MSAHNTKPVAVLGVSAYYHDSAAALVIDGRIVAAAQEERFTRVKGDNSVPKNAIDYVLKQGQLEAKDLTSIAYYENPYRKIERQLATHTVGKPSGLPSFVATMRANLAGKMWIEKDLRRLLGKNIPIYLGDHHLSHAASAYYPSGLDEAAVLTIDGVGEWSTTTIGRGVGVELTIDQHIEYPHSLGLLYSAFTHYCGFTINSGEYKLMGLAPYGEPHYKDVILANMISLHPDGSYALNPEFFTYVGGMRTYGKAFEELLGKPTREPDEPLEQYHADVSASIQAVLNEAVEGLAQQAAKTAGSTNLVLAGGVALNVVTIGHLERTGKYSNIWVQPAAGDAGGSLGAALWVSHHVHGVELPSKTAATDRMHGAYLGPEPGTADEIDNLIDDYKFVSDKVDDPQLAKAVAMHIASGEIVAIAKGRMEYGPRALGNRSILADARDPHMQQRLNLSTKFRESFRPFAPIVLLDKASEHFDMDSESPYMLKTYYVRKEHQIAQKHTAPASIMDTVKEKRSHLPAVTHVDYSARVQTVDNARNPFLHSVLQEFDNLTGTPALVNTSFNVRGEPIVCTARDAIECFLHTDIDVLVLGQHVIERAKQKAENLTPRTKAAQGDD